MGPVGTQAGIAALLGVVLLGSLATNRPLIFRLIRALTAVNPEASRATEASWSRPAVRHIYVALTVGWGLGLLAAAALRLLAP